jgi:anaphase-promoting complex subunit 8
LIVDKLISVLDNTEALALFEDLKRLYPSRLEEMDILSHILYLQEDSKERLCALASECDDIDKYRPETCIVRGNT